jgi:hypothetical protein
MPFRSRRPSGAVATVELASSRNLAALLSVQSLDLRAEYEAKLRILTEIQRDIEALRGADTVGAQRRGLDQLEKKFAALTEANRDASQTLKMIRGEFDRVRRVS